MSDTLDQSLPDISDQSLRYRAFRVIFNDDIFKNANRLRETISELYPITPNFEEFFVSIFRDYVDSIQTLDEIAAFTRIWMDVTFNDAMQDAMQDDMQDDMQDSEDLTPQKPPFFSLENSFLMLEMIVSKYQVTSNRPEPLKRGELLSIIKNMQPIGQLLFKWLVAYNISDKIYELKDHIVHQMHSLKPDTQDVYHAMRELRLKERDYSSIIHPGAFVAQLKSDDNDFYAIAARYEKNLYDFESTMRNIEDIQRLSGYIEFIDSIQDDPRYIPMRKNICEMVVGTWDDSTDKPREFKAVYSECKQFVENHKDEDKDSSEDKGSSYTSDSNSKKRIRM